MKTVIWIAGSVLILGGVISFFSFRFKGIETPNYKVIKTFGDVEIREYPQLILAQTKLGGKRYDSNGNKEKEKNVRMDSLRFSIPCFIYRY